MSDKEIEIHEVVDMGLTNLLDRIDLCSYHIRKSNEDYEHHLNDLQEMKNKIKRILNTDFDKIARNRKQ